MKISRSMAFNKLINLIRRNNEEFVILKFQR